jgi:hypothetical protein
MFVGRKVLKMKKKRKKTIFVEQKFDSEVVQPRDG